MDSKALFNLSYGVFILGTNVDGKLNACVTNTCMQIANAPVRIAISVMNTNLTCEMIKKSGSFSLSVLDETCTFDTIKHFGMQSGRSVNKFDSFTYALDENKNPYITTQACTIISAKVISTQDLGTHTLFIAEITDAKITSSASPITYSDYQLKIKPKPADQTLHSEKKIVGWRCKICGFEYKGSNLPADFICPVCGHPAEDFEPIYENPVVFEKSEVRAENN